MKERSEVRHSKAFLLELISCCWVGRLGNAVEKCRVESKEWIGQVVGLSKSLMNNRNRLGDRTEPCGTPLLIG